MWFYESSPLLDTYIAKLVRPFNPDRIPYIVGFDELENAKATIRLDKNSDNFGIIPLTHIVPAPGEDAFQLDWDIKSGILHQFDFQIPSERNLETQMLYYTAIFGIGLGITNLAMFGMEQRSRKKQDSKDNFKVDKFPKDAIVKDSENNESGDSKK